MAKREGQGRNIGDLVGHVLAIAIGLILLATSHGTWQRIAGGVLLVLGVVLLISSVMPKRK